eukprot:2046354-Amphidinium_carterae.1
MTENLTHTRRRTRAQAQTAVWERQKARCVWLVHCLPSPPPSVRRRVWNLGSPSAPHHKPLVDYTISSAQAWLLRHEMSPRGKAALVAHWPLPRSEAQLPEVVARVLAALGEVTQLSCLQLISLKAVQKWQKFCCEACQPLPTWAWNVAEILFCQAPTPPVPQNPPNNRQR